MTGRDIVGRAILQSGEPWSFGTPKGDRALLGVVRAKAPLCALRAHRTTAGSESLAYLQKRCSCAAGCLASSGCNPYVACRLERCLRRSRRCSRRGWRQRCKKLRSTRRPRTSEVCTALSDSLSFRRGARTHFRVVAIAGTGGGFTATRTRDYQDYRWALSWKARSWISSAWWCSFCHAPVFCCTVFQLPFRV